MATSLLCVQFRNLLPSEDILLFPRALWETAERERLGAFQDATLRISKSDTKVALFEAWLASGHLKSVATGREPLATIEAAFAQLRAIPVPRVRRVSRA
ncbi:MAG TPA: hypothetical protein VFX59_31625 [Polyangiales bacterium]|nr:hypothetical protein [Polyangiales bacterium]